MIKMKQFLSGFILKGLVAGAFGPPVLAIVYWILGITGAVESFSPNEVALGILSIELLAFVVGGMSTIYQREQLPLATAILIHGGVLYLTYILIYLINSWLQRQLLPILVCSAIFVTCYALIWAFIYLFNKHRTRKINQNLRNLKGGLAASFLFL